jgi:hypothetical protein
MSVAETIAMVRDLAFLAVLLSVTAIFLALYLKVSPLIGSAKRVARNTEDAVSSLSGRFTARAGGLQDLASSAGTASSLLLWPIGSWRRLGLTGLASLAGLAWARNWFGVRGGTKVGDSFDGSSKQERENDGS